MNGTLEEIKKAVGGPRNYGPTPEQRAAALAVATQRAQQQQQQLEQAESKRKAALAAEDAKKQAEWAAKLAEVRRQEQETLELAAAPLRTYLMKHVMPSLTQALLEVCKTRPDDPVDYLAEYLFKHNPQID